MARHPKARFYAVPNSVEDAQAGGLLIVAESAAEFGPRILPCAMEHGKVAVLCTTALDPLITPEEAQRLLVYHHYFFHPALGLVAFEEADALLPESLIVPLLPRETTWMHASHGHPPLPKLSRVSLILGEDESGLFGDAAGEIGRKSPTDLSSGTPLMERMRSGIAGGAAAMGMGLMKALGGLARQLGTSGGTQPPGRQAASGAGSSGPGPLERFARWAAENFDKLQQLRQSEVNRLLKMLDTDPERGLRYALPLTGDSARGQAPPGWKLGDRNPIFGGQRFGGPADVWNLAPDTQWQLQKKYRELANRELAAGRYERAAYIFAELLGDWHAAAGALAEGRLYQEAARIYLTRLNNKSLAAQCLEDGGLLADAVLLYAELNLHEKCGDLLRRLGKKDDARLAYQEAMKGSTDRLHDARILFEKLELPELALSVLATGYPGSKQAAQCLERQFEYLARLEASEQALTLATSLSQHERQIPDRLEMTKTLQAVHKKHRDPEVRSRLSIVATSLIGEAISDGTSQEKQLLQLLPQFAESDLLLRRDADRFGSERAATRKTKSPSESSTKVVLLHRKSLNLPENGVLWSQLYSRGDRWLATGYEDGIRQRWSLGDKERVFGTLPNTTSPLSERGALSNGEPLFPHLADTVWLPKEKLRGYFSASRSEFEQGRVLPANFEQNLRWMPPDIAAIFPDAGGVTILHRSAGLTLDLSSYTYQGQFQNTHALSWSPPRVTGPVFLAAHGETSVITMGNFVLRIHQGSILNEFELPLRVLRLHVTQPFQPAAFLAVTDSEVTLIAPGKGKDLENIQLFNGSSPKACFLNDGRIAVGDKDSFLLYGAYPAMNLLSSTPLIVPGRQTSEPYDFAPLGNHSLLVLYADGKLDRFE
jgi:tetratricopeptide (TPR) repeat protein